MDMKSLKWTMIAAVSAVSMGGCSGGYDLQEYDAVPGEGLEMVMVTKASASGEENVIDNLNVFVFSADGFLERFIYMTSRNLENDGDTVRTWIPCIFGSGSRIAICANFGYRLSGINTLDELAGYRLHLAYPDEFSRGLPSSGISASLVCEKDRKVIVPLERMTAKIPVRIDRSLLDNDVKIRIVSARAGNAPRSATVFGESAARYAGDVFEKGYAISGAGIDCLNRDTGLGTSGTADLYVLENLQGNLLEEDAPEKEKYPEGIDAEVCTYIELKAEYSSPDYHTPAGKYIFYRFYPGASGRSFDIRRNTVYDCTVSLSGDGLDGEPPLLDSSSLEER